MLSGLRSEKAMLIRSNSLYSSAPFGHRAKNHGAFAPRNPQSLCRCADRRCCGPLPHEPPRNSLDSSDGGPVGFCDGLFL